MRFLIKNILKTLLFLGICILFFEGFLRFTEISLPSYVYDSPDFGRIQKPGVNYFDINNEGFGMGTVNKYGYIGPAYSKDKHENTLRIALVGDSYVEGSYLFDRQHFRYILEHRLSNLLQQKVEVLNFGVGGYNLRDIYIDLRKRVLKYKPNIILVFIRNGNFYQKDKNPGPDLKLEGDSLKITYNYKNTEQYKLRKKFQLIRDYSIGNLVKESYEEYYRKNYEKTLFDKFYKLFYSNIKKKKDVKTADGDYGINRAILESMKKYNNTSTKIFIVKSTDFPGDYDNLVSRLQLSVIKLDSVLSKYAKGTDILHYWKATNEDGHWNYKAQNIIGNYLADSMYKYLYKKDSM